MRRGAPTTYFQGAQLGAQFLANIAPIILLIVSQISVMGARGAMFFHVFHFIISNETSDTILPKRNIPLAGEGEREGIWGVR